MISKLTSLTKFSKYDLDLFHPIFLKHCSSKGKEGLSK